MSNKSMDKYINKIINGNCIEEMKKMPEESVDLIFADPPYFMQTDGILHRTDGTKFAGVEDSWDKFQDYAEYDKFTTEWLKECKRVMKKDASIWVIGSFQNIYRLGYIMQNMGFWILNDVIWSKPNAVPNFGGTRFQNSHETLLWCTKSKNAKYTFNYKTMKFLNNDKQNFYLEIVEYERDLKIEDIEKCAEIMTVPLFERIAMPYLTMDKNNVVVSTTPVPVGFIHEKRMPQTLMKKSAASIKTDKRNPLSGQVVGDDKNARNSDSEVYSLATLGANAALKEFLGPRADDMRAKNEMYAEIAKNGYVAMEDLTDDVYNKVALNTFDMYFLMQGLRTNMIERLDKIPGPREDNQ